ncbi:uncharacterized protein LOC129218997 [Uloborus diversus]|uniref:uncharacterized protein LOC129218997 n=1 Tax=Uloborus diversus TaxID=327109 RepID=UPI0024098804|nr:uncharacterized protein LOC129218997 [Uloborus diversus]
MHLTYLIAWTLSNTALVFGEAIGHVTRDYFGDIFSLEDCQPGSCDDNGRRAAQIPGEKCRCQCAPSHYTFREDLKQCIKDVGECPIAMFVRPFAVERIPLVFLPMTGQLVYPGAHLTVSAPSKHLTCNVKTSLLMTTRGWQPIRTPSHIFGVYYDGNKTFLQWLGDDEDRRRLQHHLVLIRLICEGESTNGTFEPCAALRVGWAPGLEPEYVEQTTNKNNFIIIGLCLGILGLIYVGAVLIYMKVRKNRRQAARQGSTQSRNTIESIEEDSNCTQLRNAYINNLVQEAEFTSKSSSKSREMKEVGSNHTSPDHRRNASDSSYRLQESQSPHDSNHISSNGNAMHMENCSRRSDHSEDSLVSPPQPPPQEFFVRIRGMIAAAKNRLNSFRYKPTLLVIPEDDYFYQDFKERDEGSSSRKSSFKKFSRKSSNPVTTKMESIHGSNLGAAMLEAKLAPPLPPPRNGLKPKNKKRAPSPPGDRIPLPDYSRETPSPVSLKEYGGSLDRKSRKLSKTKSDNYSKFDLFRLDLYEKINRMRETGSTENEIAVLELTDGKRPKGEFYDSFELEDTSPHIEERNEAEMSEIYCSSSKRGQSHPDSKISRRQLLYKLQETEAVSVLHENTVEPPKHKMHSSHPISERYEDDIDEDWASSQAGSVVEEKGTAEKNPIYGSRPGTAMSNSSARTTSSQPSTMKENKILVRDNSQKYIEAGDVSDCSETSEDSLSGDSLNSSFRRPTKSPLSLKSKQSLHSTEDLSVISGSSVITSSTAIKEIDDYGDDDDIDEDPTQDDDSRLSTDLDPDIYSLDDSEHPSLEEYLQLSSQVAKKLSERTVPVFNSESPKEKNVISQFMKEFKTTIGRLKTTEDNKPRSSRTTSPGSDNWTLKSEEKRAKVARRVSIFKRNPLKGRKNEEPLVPEENGKDSYYEINVASETEDAESSISSTASSISGKRGKQKYKSKTPEIIPAAKVVDTGEKTVIAIVNESGQNGIVEIREDRRYTPSPVSKMSGPRIGKAVTPPLPPPKPQLDQIKLKAMATLRKSHQEKTDKSQPVQQTACLSNGTADESSKTTTALKNKINKNHKPPRYIRTPSIESDSISVANSDMTEDSLNTPIPEEDSEGENQEDLSEEENGPIDRCLAQLADSVIQPSDDCSLNRYLSQLGTVLAARDDNQLDQCLNKLAANMNANRATKGFNLSQHLPLCTWEHVCVDRGSDRSTPTSDRSSTTSRGSRGSQENLRKKTLTKAKHHHHHHHPIECKHTNGDIQVSNASEKINHLANGCLHANGHDSFATRILVERVAHKGTFRGKSRIGSTSEEDDGGRASSLGSTRELEIPVSETTSDPGSADLERPRKKRPLLRRSKKGLNGTCRQHIQNSKFNKKENGSVRKEVFKPRNLSTPRSSSSDVTVIQLEGGGSEHVTNVESSNTFVTLINVDSSDCSNSADEK